MPLFTPDFPNVDANIPVYDKGRYQLKITKRKPFARETRPDAQGNTHISAGVQYNLEMVGMYDREGNLQTDGLAGKTVSPFRGYLHTDKAWGMFKQMLLAGAGYQASEEPKANEEFFSKHDWTFDGEPGMAEENFTVGEGFDQILDRLVDVSLDKDVQKDEETGKIRENQEFSSWTPPTVGKKKAKK